MFFFCSLISKNRAYSRLDFNSCLFDYHDAFQIPQLDMEVIMKLSLIWDLMYANEIPHVVDFDEVANFDF